jgi:hypothetical protein
LSINEVNKKLREYQKTGKDPKSDAATRWLAVNMSKIESQMRPDKFNRSKKGANSPNTFQTGTMMFFGYEPRTKYKLDFWDEYPLIILIKKSGSSLLGLNLHYLKPNIRAAFMNGLLKYVDNPNYHKDPPSYLNITYQILKNSAMSTSLKKCVKRYYISNIKSKVNVIPSTEWKVTAFLPIERFKGATKQEVWDSMNRYLKG